MKIFDQIKMTQKLEESETEKKIEEKYDSDMYGIVEGLMSNLQDVQKTQIQKLQTAQNEILGQQGEIQNDIKNLVIQDIKKFENKMGYSDCTGSQIKGGNEVAIKQICQKFALVPTRENISVQLNIMF